MSVCLGIDTSCYTTSVALASRSGVSSHRKLLPVAAGERGLRQSEAVFAHVRQIGDLMDEALRGDVRIDCVCASASPTAREDSYMPVFEVGRAFARSCAAGLRVPLYLTDHQHGHVSAALYGSGLQKDRFLALHLSGGTTDALLCEGERLTPLFSSLDLHAGQLVDRVGVALGLPFPSGAHLESLAEGGTPEKIPVSFDGGDCHLSGAETAILRMIAQGAQARDVAATAYDLLCRTVLKMLAAARDQTGVSDCLLAGGVMSSARLRGLLNARNEKRGLHLNLHYGKPEFSGDNAVGVALIGLKRWQADGYGDPS